MNDKLEGIRNLVQHNSSGSYNSHLVEMIAQKPELFDLFWQVYLSLEEPVSRRSAWVIIHAVEQMPHLIARRHLDELLDSASNMKHDGEKRTLVKILTLVPIPEELFGPVLDLCFRWLNDTGESIAVRLFSMDTLVLLTRDIPEIRGELIATVEYHMENFSVGLKNKGARVLRELRRLKPPRKVNSGFSEC